MKYIALRGFCIGGGIDVHPGQQVEMDEKEAARFPGKLKPVVDEEPAPAKEKKNARK